MNTFSRRTLRSLELAIISCGSIPLPFVPLHSATSHYVAFSPLYFINTSEQSILLWCYRFRCPLPRGITCVPYISWGILNSRVCAVFVNPPLYYISIFLWKINASNLFNIGPEVYFLVSFLGDIWHLWQARWISRVYIIIKTEFLLP